MLFRRIIDSSLVLSLLAGGVWAWQLAAERSRLEPTYRRLTARVGDLEVGDPALLTLRAIPSARPLEFAWRMHIPAGPFNLKSSSGTSFSGMSSARTENAIVRLACREQDGRLFVYMKGLNGSSTTVLGDRNLMDLLRGRFNQIIVEQAGTSETVAIDPAQPLTLLKLTLPPALIAETRAKLSPQNQNLIPTLLQVDKR